MVLVLIFVCLAICFILAIYVRLSLFATRILTVKLERISKEKQKIAENLLKHPAINMSDIEFLVDFGLSGFDRVAYVIPSRYPNTVFLCFSKKIWRYDHFDVVAAHEIGHILKKHEEIRDEQKDKQQELEAWNFAAAICGIEKVGEFILEYPGYPHKDFFIANLREAL